MKNTFTIKQFIEALHADYITFERFCIKHEITTEEALEICIEYQLIDEGDIS